MKKLLKFIIYRLCSSFLIKKGASNGIYITFDDGPHPVNTPRILEILEEHGVKVTFFMVGEQMEKYPDVVQAAYSAGHSIGYHSYHHYRAERTSIIEYINDMRFPSNYEKNQGIRIKRIYRPPYGELKFLSLLWNVLNNWKTIMWSVDSRDSFDDITEVLSNVRPCNVQNGDILLFHDDYVLTTEVLSKVLTNFELEGRNCLSL